MKLEFDEYEVDLLIESVQHRIDTDKRIVTKDSIRADLEDLIRKLEDNEYL